MKILRLCHQTNMRSSITLSLVLTYMIATRAKMLSTSFPRPNKASPRIQCPSMSNSSSSCGNFSNSSDSSRPSRRCCKILRVSSIRKVSEMIASDSNRRIRGASFIRNCALSVSFSKGVRMDGRALLDFELLAVNAEIISVLDCKS
jgi:hypothetical protein